MFGSTNKVSVSEAASDLDLYHADVRDFIRDLVTVAT